MVLIFYTITQISTRQLQILILLLEKMSNCTSLLFFLFVFETLGGYSLASNDISVTQITIWPGNLNQKYAENSISNYDFEFPLDSSPSNIKRLFIIFTAYHIANTNSFNFYNNILYSNFSSVTLEFNCFGDMVVYTMSFSIIAVVPNEANIFSISNYQLSPQVLSDQTKTMNVSNLVQSWTLNSDIYFTHNNYSVLPFFSYFRCSNSVSQPGAGLQYKSLSLSSSNFVLEVSIHQGAVLTNLKIVVVVIDLSQIYNFNKIFYTTNLPLILHSYFTFPDLTFSSIVSNNSVFPLIYGPKFSRNCSIGVSLVYTISNGRQKQLLFNYSSLLGIDQVQQLISGGMVLQYNLFCLIDCQSNAFYNISTQQCELCSFYISKCQSCINSTFCNDCGPNAFFDGNYKRCGCDRSWVIGGCTNVNYCTQIDVKTGFCLKCSNMFELSPVSHLCLCQKGSAGVNGICANITGCITAITIEDSAACITCNATAGWIVDNKQCSCIQGTTFDGSSCSPHCGDGKVYFNQACDDGNNNDGDGCSSTCKVQTNYNCVNGSLNSPSTCSYIHPQIQWNVQNIYKDEKKNVAYFTFKINPYITSMDKVNFSSSITLNIQQKIQNQIISFSNGIIKVELQFLENLQNEFANISINFDANIIEHSPQSLHFEMCSENYPLVLFNYYDELQFLSSIVFYLSILAVFLFLLGTWAHRMMGAETINVFIVIYYSLPIKCINSKIIFSCLASLRYLVNYANFFINEQQNTLSSASILKLQSNFVNNNLLLLILLGISITILGIVAVYVKWSRKIARRKEALFKKGKQSFFECMQFRLAYNLTLIPVSLGYICHILCSNYFLFLAYSSQFKQKLPDSMLPLSVITLFGYVLFSECWKILLQRANEKRKYLWYFCMNCFINSLLLIVSFITNKGVYLLSTWSILYLIIIVFDRPYADKLHKLVLIINQIVIIAWFGFLISLDFIIFSQERLYLFAKILVFVLSFVSLLAFIRIAYELIKNGSQKTKSSIMAENQPTCSNLDARQLFETETMAKYQRISIKNTSEQASFPLKIFQNRKLNLSDLNVQNKNITRLEMKEKLKENLMNNGHNEYDLY